MKNIFINDIVETKKKGEYVEIYGWVLSNRSHKNILFFDLIDSTNKIQITVSNIELKNRINIIPESVVFVKGNVNITNNIKEIVATEIEILSKPLINLSPNPRSNFEIFNPKYTNLTLDQRHLYLRNPKLMAIQNIRNFILNKVRQWFYNEKYVEIAAPILTPLTLYDDESALAVNIKNQHVFLSQCAGYYLEASVMAFEKVYNISASFRGEEGKSKRHLIEYWHIKAEVAFASLEDIIHVVEEFLKHITIELLENEDVKRWLEIIEKDINKTCLSTPFKKITYNEAISLLKKIGHEIEPGERISSIEEELLSEELGGTFWLTNTPASHEPFPYSLDRISKETKVADLIGNNKKGEILGTAEKISDINELDERMKIKGKFNEKYEWIRDIHKFGCAPHSAFGIGVERLIRWLLDSEHVRDVHPFPRTFGRDIKI